MRLPEGTYSGIGKHPLQEESALGKNHFSGRVEVLTEEGAGILVVDEGRIIAAYYQDQARDYKGKDAISHLASPVGIADLHQKYVQYRYTPEQMAEARAMCSEEGVFMGGGDMAVGAFSRGGLDDAILARIFNQQGILAVSVFFEGFPVQSIGDMDFEHVAAMAEDFLRAGKKMAVDMHMGALDQVILEGGQRKCIIAPYGDLYLCLLTSVDANLGLIRLGIKNIQKELKEKG
ncbi:MAG: roadblock/LC7 domain-containing protein [Methanolinea sp.]|jgi:predicted regulator of Ras-like GTPase activity (Roadblock/LC7/MglB family)|nr:roadblock/LC7 domain-containing protein [Methanolinea sp.]